MIVLDTTVLVYAVGDDHPLREPCRRLLAAHGSGRIEAATTIEVLQEFAHIRAHRRGRRDAVTLARAYARSMAILPVSAEDLDVGLGLFEGHASLGAFHAVLAAAALGHRAEALVSADQGFAEVPGIAWIDPATAALERLID